MCSWECVVHGGAWSIPDEATEDHIRGVSAACAAAASVLAKGGAALDAVEAAVVAMEDDPTFDAGRGSFLTKSMSVEMDAIIGDSSRNVGAVAGIKNVKNPVRAARKVMQESDHVLLVGDGAREFAISHGVKEASEEVLLVGRELERYRAFQSNKSFDVKSVFGKLPKGCEHPMGTVGCVARDQHGSIAVAVSTGGIPMKQTGRVGDSPIWGAGAFASNECSAAATGYGEDILRSHLTLRACDLMDAGISPMSAAKRAIDGMESLVDGLGGIITLSKEGVGWAFNTPRMAWATASSHAALRSGIE